jgi:cell division protein FtsQ
MRRSVKYRRRTVAELRQEPATGEQRYQQIPLPVHLPLAPGGRRGPVRAYPKRRAAPIVDRRVRLAVLLGMSGAAAVVAGLTFGISRPLNWAFDAAAEATQRLQADSGYRIEEVLVEGRGRTDAEVLRRALNVARGDPILAFDPQAARESLEKLSWVASARVERMLPDTIYIRLTERQPLALWQNQRRLALIDATGAVLENKNLEHFAHLPIVVGPDAPKHAAEFLAALSGVPSLASRVEAATFIGGRRWDLRLDNGVDVRLPEGALVTAMKRLADLERVNGLFERDILAIDMRLPDRTVVQTSRSMAKRGDGPGQKI